MNKNLLYLSSSGFTISVIDKYSENLTYPLQFNGDESLVDIDFLIEECESRLENISKEIRELLVIKLLLKENNIIINENLLNEINMRIENEILCEKDEVMKKLFNLSELEEDNKEAYINRGVKCGLNYEMSI